MTIRTTRGGRAWTREEPTQLELVQSHLENKIIYRGWDAVYTLHKR